MHISVLKITTNMIISIIIISVVVIVVVLLAVKISIIVVTLGVIIIDALMWYAMYVAFETSSHHCYSQKKVATMRNTHSSIARERIILNPDDRSPEPRKRHACAARRTSCSRVTASFSLAFRFSVYNPPQVDRIWGIWGSGYNIPKAIFYLLKGDYRGLRTLPFHTVGFSEKQWAL